MSSTGVLVMGGSASSAFPPTTATVSCSLDVAPGGADGAGRAIQMPDLFMPNATAIGGTVAMINGTVLVSVPSGATVMILVPPSGNANIYRIKGSNGDTGVQLDPAAVQVFTLDPSQTTVYLQAGASFALGVLFL